MIYPYSPEIEKKIRKHLRLANIHRELMKLMKVKGEWKYLYRTVDSDGNSII